MNQSLDSAVDKALGTLGEALPAPQALFSCGTGLGTLPGALRPAHRVTLAEVPGVPRPWRDAELHAGKLGALDVWLIEDAPGDLEFGEGGAPIDPPWARCFPIWLAAAAGATLGVVTGAAGSVRSDLKPPGLVIARDHMNLSGRSPLEGMGQTRLGPLFPDQSSLLDRHLRERAVHQATRQGIELNEVVVAGTLGPALATPAERRWYRAAGADVFAQEFSSTMVACAHAGLATLAILAVTDQDEEPLSMAELVARAEAAAPALEDLLVSLVSDLAETAGQLEGELS